MGLFDIFKKSKAEAAAPSTTGRAYSQSREGKERYPGKIPREMEDMVFKYVAEADKTRTGQISEEAIIKSIESREKEFIDNMPFYKSAEGQKFLKHMVNLATFTGTTTTRLGKSVARLLGEDNVSEEIKGTIKHY